MIVGTVCSAAHLPRAMVMARSVKQHMPDCKVVVGLVEENMIAEAWTFPFFDEVVLIKNICVFPNYYKFLFQYTPQEAAGSSKGLVMNYIYNKYTSEELMIYLDSDIKAMSPFEELPAMVERHPILIVGHLKDTSTFDMARLKHYRKCGIYNSGFIVFKRHPEAKRFIDWWVQKCERFGYFDYEQGIYTDQTWLDFAHNYFEDVYSIRHSGYNVGPWNMTERWNINALGNGQFTIDGVMLRCMHFSSHYDLVTGWMKPPYAQIYQSIYRTYTAELHEMGQEVLGKKQWSYSTFANGEPIHDSTRRNFRERHYELPQISNPYLLSNSYFQGQSAAGSDKAVHSDHRGSGKRSVKGRAKRRAVRGRSSLRRLEGSGSRKGRSSRRGTNRAGTGFAAGRTLRRVKRTAKSGGNRAARSRSRTGVRRKKTG